MKYPKTIAYFTMAFLLSVAQAAYADNKKHTFNITVQNSAGNPQVGMILKVSGLIEEHRSDTTGLIKFEQELNPNYIRTAKLFFPDNKEKPVKSFHLNEAVTDTIFRIDSPDDLLRFKKSGQYFTIQGVVSHNNAPLTDAEVQIQGTGRRTKSDKGGYFTIDADYSHPIMIRATGMENRYLDIQEFLSHPEAPLAVEMEQKNSERIYANVDQMPEYPGGMKALHRYLKRRLQPAKLAEDTDVEGVIVVQFVVEKDGKITSPALVRHLDARLDSAVVQTFRAMPRWIPGKDNRRNVRCKYSIPVRFKKPAALSSGDTLHAPAPKAREVIPAMPVRPGFIRSQSAVPQPGFTAADSLRLEPRFSASPVTEKKRSAFVRFFRRLFGKKD